MSQGPQLSKTRRIINWAILILGFFISVFIITPKYTEDIILRLSIGWITGLALVYLMTPELMKFLLDSIFQRNLSQLQKDRLKKARKFRFWRSITHPTTIPLLLGIGLWILTGLILGIFKIELKENLFLVIMFVTAFLFSFSGILMIVRREAIGENGHVIQGFGAILHGIVWIIISLGLVYVALKISTFQ